MSDRCVLLRVIRRLLCAKLRCIFVHGRCNGSLRPHQADRLAGVHDVSRSHAELTRERGVDGTRRDAHLHLLVRPGVLPGRHALHGARSARVDVLLRPQIGGQTPAEYVQSQVLPVPQIQPGLRAVLTCRARQHVRVFQAARDELAGESSDAGFLRGRGEFSRDHGRGVSVFDGAAAVLEAADDRVLSRAQGVL